MNMVHLDVYVEDYLLWELQRIAAQKMTHEYSDDEWTEPLLKGSHTNPNATISLARALCRAFKLEPENENNQ
jgi:hypothetical protein